MFFLSCAVCIGQAQSNKKTDEVPGRIASPRAQKVVLSSDLADGFQLVESEFDFGNIPQGIPVEHTFRFVNKGKDSLKVDMVRTSCGCTTPRWSQEMVAPGDTSSMVVGYNAEDLGEFYRSITMIFNGDEVRQFYIKGKVFAVPNEPAPENKLVRILNNHNR